MLDERLEYTQYSHMSFEDFSEDKVKGKNKLNCRLKYGTLIADKCSGLDRAMTTVARYYIYDMCDGKFNAGDTKEFLKSWCGFRYDANVMGTDSLNHWLIKYIINVFLYRRLDKLELASMELGLNDDQNEQFRQMKDYIQSCSRENHYDLRCLVDIYDKTIREIVDSLLAEKKIKEGNTKNLSSEISIKLKECLIQINKICEFLSKWNLKAAQFGQELFSAICSPAVNALNDYRKITYDRIIANALELGKLKTYYLVCNENIDPFSDIIRATVPNSKKADKNSLRIMKLSDADRDCILKMTAAYLLGRKNDNQEWVAINQIDMVNWLTTTKFNIKKYYITHNKDDIPIFDSIVIGNEATKGTHGNVAKIKIVSEWVKRFSIAEKEETKERIIFIDQGAGLPLEKG